MIEVPRWTVAEAALESAREYDNPFQDVTVRVRLTAPSGRQQSVEAFWDGEHSWRARFCPDEPGDWRWESASSDTTDGGLHARAGDLRCVSYGGDNPLYRHGPPRLSDDRRHFAHADGTPFFWLGDTAWSGPMRSEPADWDAYLHARRRQGFSLIQFVGTQFRGCTRDSHGETAFAGTEHIRLNPRFCGRLDQRVAAINEAGLVAAPVLLWAWGEGDPGQALAEGDATRLARYLVARWGAYHTVWMLGGDGDYRGERAERWRRIGRAVFGEHPARLATMHPGGQQWVGDEFRHEAWCNFTGYQSGHGSAPDHLRWLVAGPPATAWQVEPPRPVVNLEPNYETHLSYHGQRRFTDFEVRRATYWSLLVAPTAGVTFGHNAIWPWSEQAEVPEGHPRLGVVAPWREGLESPGVRSMTILRRFLDPLPWWHLRPAPELLTEQPGEDDPERFVAVARTDRGELVLAYLPQGGAIGLRTASLPRPGAARWFDPRTGEWTDAGATMEGVTAFTAPGDGDWLLLIESADGRRWSAGV